MEEILSFINDQLDEWKFARDNYDALKNIRTREVKIDNTTYKIQYNPARIVSSAAKVDPKSLQTRKCFLCSENRPKEQKSISFKNRYEILVNPFPIFPQHLTIPDKNHTPQRIIDRFRDMVDLAEYLPAFTVFYNGPKCGASAPDHAHFQAGIKGFLPIEIEWKKQRRLLITINNASLWELDSFPCASIVIEATQKNIAEQLFRYFYQSMENKEDEPMMNILVWKELHKWIIIIFPRKTHRPSCYFAEGNDNILISPASVDLGGVFITPLEKDFNKITAEDIKQILEEVCLSRKEMTTLEQRLINRI